MDELRVEYGEATRDGQARPTKTVLSHQSRDRQHRMIVDRGQLQYTIRMRKQGQEMRITALGRPRICPHGATSHVRDG
jgi:hypothetical protein